MSADPSFTISPVRSPADLTATIRLFTIYAQSLGIDLSLQSFDIEMSTLPGKYAPPHGELYVARDNASSQPLGCVGLRPLGTGLCEMKRLYVTPEGRGLGLGKALVGAVLERAGELGYDEIRLDTLLSMGAAVSLYRGVGFMDIEPYYETPIPGMVFLGRKLGGEGV